MNLCLLEKWISYIKKLEKFYVSQTKDEIITLEKNVELYELLIDKHLNTVYSKRESPHGQKLLDGKDVFLRLDLKQQCEALIQILQLTKIGITETNLNLIGEASRTGLIRISKNLKELDNPAIINQSVTGLYENKIWIFGDKLDK